MTCESCRNRLLALEQPARPPADLRDHLAGCAGCRAAQAKAVRIDALVAALPVPSSDRAKAELIALLEDGGTVEPRSAVLPFLRRWATPFAIAAALLIAAGGFWLLRSGPKEIAEVPSKPRHELLAKEVANIGRLATAADAPARLRVWTEWATALRGEARDLYKVAPADELLALSRLYDRAVTEGVVNQAGKLPDHRDAAEKADLLRTADARLAETAAEAERLHHEAPPQAQLPLKRIAESAREGRRKLAPLLDGIAALPVAPAAGPSSAGPATAAEHLALWKDNRKLLEELVEEGVRLGDANTPLDRMARCQSATGRLATELRNAVGRNDADRVAEVGDYFADVVKVGFVPNLEAAKEQIPPGSRDYNRLKTLHADSAKGMAAARDLIPPDGKLGKLKRVQDARTLLAAAVATVGQPKEE